MRFGLSLNTQAPPDGRRLPDHYEALLAQVELAESLGYDFVAVPEHHQSADGYLPQPLVLLAAMAARTTHIKLVTSIMQLPLHHPLAVAEQAAIVDNLSRGRLVLGIGTGWRETEFAGFGVDRRQAVSRLEQAVPILREVWESDGVRRDDGHVPFPPVDIHPKPVNGSVPIWLGAMAEAGVRRAARIADGWILDTFHTFESAGRMSALYRGLAAEAGRPATVVLSRGAWVCDTVEEARTTWWPHFVAEARRYAGLGLMDKTRYADDGVKAEDDAQWSFDALGDDRFLFGTPQSLVELLRRYRDEVAADVILLRLQNPTGPDMPAVHDNMRRFAEGVIPAFAP